MENSFLFSSHHPLPPLKPLSPINNSSISTKPESNNYNKNSPSKINNFKKNKTSSHNSHQHLSYPSHSLQFLSPRKNLSHNSPSQHSPKDKTEVLPHKHQQQKRASVDSNKDYKIHKKSSIT